MDHNKIHHGLALDILKTLESDSIDCMVTDPPYGYSFMNKDWDRAVVGVETWQECLRVLKPGSFACVMSSPRQDVLARMVVNLQDAGFRTDFTSIYWTYASGFPKAANISKLVDKRGLDNPTLEGSYAGFQPKPAVEVILFIMKPLSEKTFIDQALSNQKGVTWLDSGRIPFQDEKDMDCSKVGHVGSQKFNGSHYHDGIAQDILSTQNINPNGRFPANLLVSDDVLNDGKVWRGATDNHKASSIYGNQMKDKQKGWGKENFGSYSRYFSLDAWFNTTFPFIITPKPSPAEKNRGLDRWINPEKKEVVKNSHPTVKSIKLMSYLISLISRPGNDIVLDPFIGSGTTAIAAKLLNRKWLGIEMNGDYVKIANERIGGYCGVGGDTAV